MKAIKAGLGVVFWILEQEEDEKTSLSLSKAI